MSKPGLILHIGAPKCGSSALQAALSAQPDLTDKSGQKYRYIVYRAGRRGGRLLAGRAVTLAARMSPYGYVSWPNVLRLEDGEFFWSAMRQAVETGSRHNHIPILSNEGWIAHAEGFSEHLLQAGGPQAEVIAFVRPPLEWLNAAYWQWGVWGGMDFRTWVTRPASRYRLGAQIAAWSKVPGVRLTVRTAKQDVVGAFSDHFDLGISGGKIANSSSPPALIGFLQRNRRFRPTAHVSAVEFVFQRWCRVEKRNVLWAFKPREVQQLRDDFRSDVELMMNSISPEDAAALRADPRWLRTAPYHDQMREPSVPLDDRDALADLYVALLNGIEDCARASGIRRQASFDPLPAASASIDVWDAVIAQALDALVETDRTFRQGWLSKSRVGRWFAAQLPGSGAKVSGPDQP